MNRFISLCLIVFVSCQTEKPEFKEWHKVQNSQEGFKDSTAIFYSKPLNIDTIYRSMQGPYEIKEFSIGDASELVWITAYQTELLSPDFSQILSSEFMCHNNLNYAKAIDIPWKLKTSGANNRIFTLSQGQTKINFPDGFGIPILGNQSFKMVSQVLNHNHPSINMNLIHKSTLSYSRNTLIPLYQQSVFVTKQIGGPEGPYGLPLSCLKENHEHGDTPAKKELAHCEISFEGGKYDPYQDDYGRRYTGHWTIPKGRSQLKTNVTAMLDLEEDTKIHAISVHLHPYAEQLELWDITSDTLLYSAELSTQENSALYESIGYYSSESGINLFADHQYELHSTYNNTDSSDQHTAMAVMYLYLRDQ